MKVHETAKGRIVAACDRELLGSVLADGDTVLDLEKHRSFFEGKKAEPDELKKELEAFTSANLVGEKAVKAALELQLAEKEAIMYINKTPHIQLYRL